ncbi:MAG TPA: hypothetical protein VN698_06140 [Bacteroidia bacterium]|nr:hypothetical protein [Bacteroidia bacterium]
MYKPSVEQIKKAFVKKGYPLRKGNYELNIIGIRNDNATPNSFDDTICVLFKDEYGEDVLLCFPATTDPGTYWLEHPMNVDGCAIMQEGHYTDVYKIGIHKDYKALQQIGKIHYVRDNNKNNVLDFDAPKKITDVIATNIHHADGAGKSVGVDKWSAGCQVIQKGWNEFIELCDKARLITERNLFDYTLLNIKDVKYA